jgi:hypothetical protein
MTTPEGQWIVRVKRKEWRAAAYHKAEDSLNTRGFVLRPDEARKFATYAEAQAMAAKLLAGQRYDEAEAQPYH